MLCIKCKKDIPDGATFCPWCGKKQTREPRKALKRANGTGTVYKASGRRRKPWAAQKNRVLIGYFETKTAALDELNKLAGRSISERYNMTFKDVYESWSEERFNTITVGAQRNYNTSYKAFSSIYNKPFRTLRTIDFQQAMSAGGKNSPASMQKYKSLAIQLSEWAIREEIINTNFARFIQVPTGVKKEKEIFTDEEINILEQNGTETARIILMMIYTGMRIGELFKMNASDVHTGYAIGGEKTDAGRDRIIPIRPEGQKHFDYFIRNATGEKLISGYTGNRTISWFRDRDYKNLLNTLSIPYKSPHSCRHTFASWARKNDIKPEILQKMLGHANYETTANIYVHTDINDILNAVSVASSLQSKKEETP